jgi:hypothetical protein
MANPFVNRTLGADTGVANVAASPVVGASGASPVNELSGLWHGQATLAAVDALVLLLVGAYIATKKIGVRV